MIDFVERRILGGFRCVDAITGKALSGPFSVDSPGWTIKQTRSGTFAIFNGPTFDTLTTQFVPSGTWPAPVTFEVTIADPNRLYLPRRASIQAPQAMATLSQPQRVTLYPAASAAVAPNWAVVRASVVNVAKPDAGLPWAALRIVRTADNKQLAAGVADARGEALLSVPGLAWRTSMSGSGPVTETTLAVAVIAYFDPGTLTRPSSWIPNPDDIFANLTNSALKSASLTVALAPGRTVYASLDISV